MLNDAELLRDYAERGLEEAFRSLVERPAEFNQLVTRFLESPGKP